MKPADQKKLMEIKDLLFAYLEGKKKYLDVSSLGVYYCFDAKSRKVAGFDAGKLVDIDYYHHTDPVFGKEMVNSWINEINHTLKT
jgi:hypothetical protein